MLIRMKNLCWFVHHRTKQSNWNSCMGNLWPTFFRRTVNDERRASLGKSITILLILLIVLLFSVSEHHRDRNTPSIIFNLSPFINKICFLSLILIMSFSSTWKSDSLICFYFLFGLTDWMASLRTSNIQNFVAAVTPWNGFFSSMVDPS